MTSWPYQVLIEMGGMHPNTPYLFTMNIPDGQYLEWIVIILSDEITSPFTEHGSFS